MFENLGGGEMLLIFLVILIFFGPKKIPELATSLGKGMRKFRDAKEGLEDQFKTVMKEPMEMLQQTKTQFDQHVADAQVSIQDTAKAFNANIIPVSTPTPHMADIEPVPTPAPPINPAP